MVTGAASGIGRELARGLHARGARLVLADVNDVELAAVAAELDARAEPIDVGVPDAMQRLVDVASDASIVCLNAGVLGSSMGHAWEVSAEEWDRVFRVNLGGVVNGLRAFVPRLLERSDETAILITASLAGLATWPGGGPYPASKHAVVAVAEQTALALDGSNVAVTLLCPALVRTAMSEEGDDPADIAREALDALNSTRFVVMPSMWRQSVIDRGQRLAVGQRPELPKPTA